MTSGHDARATGLDPRMVRLRSGDRAALDALLTELLPKVRRWLLRLLGPRPDLDDATQDALIELAKALPRFEGRSRLDTFARKVTLRVAYRYFQGKRVVPAPLHLVPAPPDELDPESVAMSKEALRRLHHCLERLPQKRRVAFVLCDVEGLSPQEAAEVVGARPGAIRSRLMHARREVRRMLAHDPYIAALTTRGAS